MFSVRNYHQGSQVLLAACDPDLLGSDHAEGDLRLQVPESFYGGMEVDEAELRNYLESCTIANLVGPRTIEVAVDMGMVEAAHVRSIGGVPHAQMVVI